MIRSREELKAASERVFCEDFLVPLFRAMGFQDVVYWHGGPLERGKDLVMWAPGPLGQRVYYGVVAKVKKITGKVAMQHEVLQQIQQALANSFRDPTTGLAQYVTQVIVACTHDISKEALEALAPLLEQQSLRGHAEFLGSDRLWEMAEKRLMPWLIADSLSHARSTLLEIDPDYAVEANLTQNAIHYTITPKHAGAPQLTLNTDADFPNTEEGGRLRKAFAEFIRTGGPVTVDEPIVPFVNPPPLFRYLMPSKSQGPF